MNILCAICSDLVNQADNIYVTKCGHIFHFHCLSQWIERSKSCPQCRNKVTEKCMFRLYPTISSEVNADDAATLQSKLDDARLQLRQQKADSKAKDDKINGLAEELMKHDETIKALGQKLASRESAVSVLKDQVKYLKVENKQVNKLKEENEALNKNLHMLHGLQRVLNATTAEVEQMLQGYSDVRTVTTFAAALKRALCESEAKKNELRDKLQSAKQQLSSEKLVISDLQAKVVNLEDQLSLAESKCEQLRGKRKAPETDKSIVRQLSNSHKLPRRQSEIDTSFVCGRESIGTMVNKIENADSPYLNLKQSCLALTAINRAPLNIPVEKIKPSEVLVIESKNEKPRKETSPQKLSPHSIFFQKQPITPQGDKIHDIAQLDISYDGMGGHSKPDIFPIPLRGPVLRSNVPKLTAKHKLRRPTPSGCQKIEQMFEKKAAIVTSKKVK